MTDNAADERLWFPADIFSGRGWRLSRYARKVLDRAGGLHCYSTLTGKGVTLSSEIRDRLRGLLEHGTAMESLPTEFAPLAEAGVLVPAGTDEAAVAAMRFSRFCSRRELHVIAVANSLAGRHRHTMRPWVRAAIAQLAARFAGGATRLSLTWIGSDPFRSLDCVVPVTRAVRQVALDRNLEFAAGLRGNLRACTREKLRVLDGAGLTYMFTEPRGGTGADGAAQA